MLKKSVVLFAFLLSVAAQAQATTESSSSGWLAGVQYSWLYQSESEYRPSTGGTKYSSMGDIDVRLFGPELGYRWGGLLGQEPLSLTTRLGYYFHTQVNTKNEMELFMGALDAAYAFGSHEPFVSVTYQNQMRVSSLDYSPALGYRVGYQYKANSHFVGVSHSMRMLRSENPAGQVFDQKSMIRSLDFFYNYLF